MSVKTYSIVSMFNKEISKFECSQHSLPKLIDDFIEKDGEILCISIMYEYKKREIQKYYNSKYSSFLRKYKNGKLSEEEYLNIKQELKDLKNNCDSKEEFEVEFQKYLDKKSTNNISPYNVSDK